MNKFDENMIRGIPNVTFYEINYYIDQINIHMLGFIVLYRIFKFNVKNKSIIIS